MGHGPKRRAGGDFPEIPDKLSFKIGEVSRIAGVKAHVLRYWETEFPALRPQKSSTQQRLYRRADVETVLLIKRLLYDEGFTIAGANKRLHELTRTRSADALEERLRRVIGRARSDLEALLAELDDGGRRAGAGS